MNLFAVLKDLTAKMGEYQPACVETVGFHFDAPVVEVRCGASIEITTLTDEQVRSFRVADEILGPSSISRVKDGFAVLVNPVTEADLVVLMGDSKWFDMQRTQFDGSIRGHFDESGFEGKRARSGFPVHGAEQLPHAFFGARWPHDLERTPSLCFVEVFEEEEGQPRKVVAVQVTDQNAIDPVGLETELFHRTECGGAAVEQ